MDTHAILAAMPPAVRPHLAVVLRALEEAVATEARLERARLAFWKRPPRNLREAAAQGWTMHHADRRPVGVEVFDDASARAFVSAGWQPIRADALGTVLEPPEGAS